MDGCALLGLLIMLGVGRAILRAGVGLELAGLLFGAALLSLTVVGFLTRGRKRYLLLAIVSGFYLVLMASLWVRSWEFVRMNGVGVLPRVLMGIVLGMLPHVVAGWCALVLFARAQRRWKMLGPEERKGSRGGAGLRGEAAARVIRERAMERFGLKEADLGRSLVGEMNLPPGEVGGFVTEMDEEFGMKLEESVDVRTVSVEGMMKVAREWSDW
ncbi:hypothetical protein OKA04_24195 [Luteolibacter flavescens]|uniref:Acyl carrier protein n=1 Tax=Luteolibacter flavescens TaxID=1859460 RepID=A0ABT3FWB0_9BACT|nr:hypothetical protein [Luteolibacter flavescens]MCW1887862.1 hypothetical protein [Luteolibacter flavescens]